MSLLARLLPRSLAGRVFALYSLALIGFVAAGLGLFYRYQFTLELENTQEHADSLMEVAMPTIADSAVIGDYDTIRRTLERAIHRSNFASAAFIDVNGGMVQAVSEQQPEVVPPRWLQELIAQRLYDANLPISVGGRDYGVLRLRFAADRIAGGLWRQARYALALALCSLVGGLVLIRVPLMHWLGDLEQIQSFEESMRSGTQQPRKLSADNAPIEFKQTFDVLNRAAASLQVQREQAAVTLGAIGDSVFTLDAEGRIVLANPAACDMLGQSAEALLGRPARELLPGLFDAFDDHRPWRARRAQVMVGRGRQLVLDSNLSAIAGADGEPNGHVLACRDVSEQHALDQRLRAELSARESAMTSLRGVLEGLMPQAAGHADASPSDDIAAISQLISRLVSRLQERGEQLSAIFALSPDGFVSFDQHRQVNYVSPAFTRLTGLAESQVLGLSERQFARQVGAQCVNGGPSLQDFGALPHADELSSTAHHRRDTIELERPAKRVLEIGLRQGRSQAISQVLHLRDVTHETEVDQLKSEFLSTAAHELRTPMASIYGFSELMMARELSPERQKEVISTIHRQTELMISIVNELLDLARIEARRGKDFSLEDVDLRELAHEVMHDFKPPHERPSPIALLPDEPLRVRVDRSKMTQALGNVLSNAYKYSPGGGVVRVTLVHEDKGPGARRVGIAVSDQGIGMTPEQLARVSERFYRADTSGSIPGTGLGMSIVKEIVELLGGSLTLASTFGQGTTATLWLPLVAEAATQGEPVTA